MSNDKLVSNWLYLLLANKSTHQSNIRFHALVQASQQNAADLSTMQAELFPDEWFRYRVEISQACRINLSGENSLYEDYMKACSRMGVIPVTIEELARAIEVSAALHLKIRIRKTKGMTGVIYCDIRLKKEAREAEEEAEALEAEATEAQVQVRKAEAVGVEEEAIESQQPATLKAVEPLGGLGLMGGEAPGSSSSSTLQKRQDAQSSERRQDSSEGASSSGREYWQVRKQLHTSLQSHFA